jgi:hypothetical protein
MKKTIAAVMISAALNLIILTGCESTDDVSITAAGDSTTTTTAAATADDKAETTAAQSRTATEITSAIVAIAPIAEGVEKGIDDLTAYFYDMDTTAITDASYVVCANGAYPDEVLAAQFADEDAAAAAQKVVEKHWQSQKTTWESYRPDEVYKLENAVIERNGTWLYYIVTSDNDAAAEVLK